MGEKRDYTIRRGGPGFPDTYTFGDNPSLMIVTNSPNPFILKKDGISYVIDPSSIDTIFITAPGLFRKGEIWLSGFDDYGCMKYTCEGKDIPLSFEIKRRDSQHAFLYLQLKDYGYNVTF